MYGELEEWKNAQTIKIQDEKRISEVAKKRILRTVLNSEIEMLQTLDKQKLEAKKQQKEEHANRFFEEIGRPKMWRNSDGRFNVVTTQHTLRAAELSNLFQRLQNASLSLVS